MHRTHILGCALALLAWPAWAQTDAEVLYEDLRVSVERGGHQADVAATEIQRLAKTLDKPETLLPLAEQLLASRQGTAEYGLVGAGYTALARIVEGAADPRAVLPALERAMFEHPDPYVREWITSSLVRLARRAPREAAALARRATTHSEYDVRDVASSAVAEVARGLPPLEGLKYLDSVLKVTESRTVIEVVETVGYRILVRAGKGADPVVYRALLDGVIEQVESESLKSEARQRRIDLIRRQAEMQGKPKPDRWANARHADGSLNWGKLFSNPFGSSGEGFANPRAGAGGEVVKGYLPDVVARAVFETVQQAAVAEAEAAGRSAETLRGLQVEFLETNDIRAGLEGRRVQVSYGLLHEVYARSMQLMEAGAVTAGERGVYQARVLGLVFAHELAHAEGLKAERAADARAVRTVWSSMLQPQNKAQVDVLLESTLALFDRPTGRSAFSNLLYRIGAFVRYGTPGGRLTALQRAAAGEPDPLQRFRRADGTLKWGELGAHHARSEAAGLMKFGLALFLKELAVVAKTGDRARIEEFFDGLMTTDFYKHYGMFVVGARAGEVTYARYLQRYVKPRFVSGVLKTNLALATGLALPLIVEGEFEGQAFAISFGALGLSSAAVKLGMQGIRWATPLREARATGLLGRLGPAAGRVARLGGWLYTVGELAVVLLLAEEIEGRVHAWIDESEARAALGAANAALVETARRPGVDAETLDAAVAEARDAWIGWRDFLFRPLELEELRLAERMNKLARQAKRSEDERRALLAMLERQPGLKRWAREQMGSIQAYVDSRLAQRDDALKGEVDELLADYDARRARLLDEAYQGERRPHALFADRDAEELSWLFGGAGAHGVSPMASYGRRRAQGDLAEALADEVSGSRLQVYEDELRFFTLLARELRTDGEDALAQRLLEARARAVVLQQADTALATGQGGIQQVLESAEGRGQ